MTTPGTDPSAGSDPTQSSTESETYDATLRYLSGVVAREARRPGVRPPVPSGPERVRDVMVTSVVTAHEGAVFKEIVDALIRNRVSAVPVIDADRKVLGVVSEADLLARVSKAHLVLPRGHRLSAHSDERRKLHAATASELMTSPAYVIAPHAAIAEAAWHAARSRVRRLPVVDDNGILVGIVTRSDLLRPFLRPDEEIRDDITQNLVVGAFMLNTNSVVVEVDEGVVTLRGQIERRTVALELVDNVRGWSGVVDVIDKLTYETDDTLPGSVPAVLY